MILYANKHSGQRDGTWHIFIVSLATKVAASEYTLDTGNPSKNDVEGLMGLTSNLVGPNNGEKTAYTMKKEYQKW